MKKINLLLISSILFPLQFTHAAAPNVLRTNTGFYYPANMEHDSIYYGYGERNPSFGNRCHLANDYKLGQGSPVYSAGEGEVTQASLSIPGYGSDAGAPGGLMVIKHKTADGKTFYGLYGHIKNFKVAIGDTVSGGQKIAEVGAFISNNKPLPHLHFAINPNTPSFQGYTPTNQCKDLRGFVDPEVYLKTQTARRVAAETCDAADDAATTTRNTIVTIGSILSNDRDTDGDTLSILSVQDSTQGVVVTNNFDGTLTYTPPIDFTGADSFFYTMTDNNGCTDRATINVIVSGGGVSNPIKSSGGGSASALGLLSLLSLGLMRFFRRKRQSL